MPDDTLGTFLRARRNAAPPSAYPFASATRRRVPGLRREEVAELAGLSTDYYIRLEQGRERHPSQQVVRALSAALQLTDAQDGHLHRLAGLAPQRLAATADGVEPALADLMDSLPDSAAFILDPLLNITRMNPLAKELFSGFADDGAGTGNLARFVFLDPAGRKFFVDWERSAASCAGSLRATMHLHPSAQERDALLGELLADSEFARLWQQHDVEPKTRAVKQFRHERAGLLSVDFQTFNVAGAPGQQLVVYRDAQAPGGGNLVLLHADPVEAGAKDLH